MGVANVPSAAGGGIKSVQRGSAGASGNVTITAVDIAKSFVNVFGTTSSGTVAATGAVAGITGNIAQVDIQSTAHYTTQFGISNNNAFDGRKIGRINATTFSGNASNISGGTTNLVAAVVQGFLANSTTLTVSGACRWEVVEFA
jgi:hypothetical protein